MVRASRLRPLAGLEGFSLPRAEFAALVEDLVEGEVLVYEPAA